MTHLKTMEAEPGVPHLHERPIPSTLEKIDDRRRARKKVLKDTTLSWKVFMFLTLAVEDQSGAWVSLLQWPARPLEFRKIGLESKQLIIPDSNPKEYLRFIVVERIQEKPCGHRSFCTGPPVPMFFGSSASSRCPTNSGVGAWYNVVAMRGSTGTQNSIPNAPNSNLAYFHLFSPGWGTSSETQPTRGQFRVRVSCIWGCVPACGQIRTRKGVSRTFSQVVELLLHFKIREKQHFFRAPVR